MTMPAQHPRQEDLNRFRRELHARLWDEMRELDLDYFQMGAVIARHQANLLRTLRRMAAELPDTTETDTLNLIPADEKGQVFAVATCIANLRPAFPAVTTAELMLALAEFQMRVADYLLRWERSGQN